MNRKRLRLIWILFILIVLFIPAFIYSIKINAFGLYGPLPGLKRLENPDPDLSSELYSADGVILGKYFRHNRTPVDFEELSPELVNTLLVTEDIRFYDHSGIDLRGLGRVLIYSIILQRDAGGGSTLSQQLAKILFKTRSELNDGLLNNVPLLNLVVIKLKEWIVAVQLEVSYTKEEILAMYLNIAEFGSNTYGIQSAAATFFNKLPSELTYSESALLVGMVNAPTRYSPILNPENALNKRTEVLYNLHKYEHIDRLAYDSLKTQPLGLQYKVQNQNLGPATYFRTIVRNYLVNWAKENGYDLFDDGLKIYTTIDSRMQEYAEKALYSHMAKLQATFDEHWEGEVPWRDEDGFEIENFLENSIKRTEYYRLLRNKYGVDHDSIEIKLNEKKPMRIFSYEGEIDTVFSAYDSLAYYKQFLQAGFMSMDPHTGHIKAWVGGIDHKYFKFDHVKQGRRQPGSTIKPIVYSAAIADGFSPCFPVLDAPITFEVSGDPPTWTPDNAEGKWSGETMTIRKAMANSVNSITAWIIKKLTPQRVVEQARSLGIVSPLAAVPALCLGAGGDISLYEMVGAYSTFVNSGTWTEPIYITRIEDKNGAIIEEFVPQTREALSEETAYLMVHMLKGATEEEGGTARGLNWDLRNENEIGGKTGTTQNASDGWFMGITKDLVSGAWVGGDDRSIHFKSWTMGQGARTAMPIWQNYMIDVYKDPLLDYEKGPFPKPPNRLSIEIDCEIYGSVLNEPDSLMNTIDEINEDDIF
ncbi:MAG: transglycosylase domain-containing protein [Cyclobacteriaceae bacterium]